MACSHTLIDTAENFTIDDINVFTDRDGAREIRKTSFFLLLSRIALRFNCKTMMYKYHQFLL